MNQDTSPNTSAEAGYDVDPKTGYNDRRPFVPILPENDHVKRSQATVIIILLICILAVSAASVAIQFIQPNMMGARNGGFPASGGFNGSPEQGEMQQAPPTSGDEQN